MPRWTAMIVLAGVVSCTPAEPPTPPPSPELRGVSVTGDATADGPLSIDVTLAVVSAPLEAEARVLVGFPHWYYGMGAEGTPTVSARLGDQPLPGTLRELAWGRWYAVATLDRPAPVGSVLTVSIAGAPSPEVPGELVPLVLLDPHGGDDPVAVADVPGIFVAPGAPTTRHRSRVVRPLSSGRRVVWADLHGHSALSDGRGTPGSYFAFAKARGRLQVAALSDHDWQLDSSEFTALLDAADAAYVPSEFVALPALETNVHGHEVMWFFDTDAVRAIPGAGSVRGARTIWEETDFGREAARFEPRARELGMRLRGSVLSASHTTLARGMGTPAPRPFKLPGEACIEIYSAHGSSECVGCARAVSSGDADGPVSDVRAHLAANPDLCLIAAGDSHDGRPGDTRWGPHSGGVTGMEVDELTRGGVLGALRAGRTWATTGRRTVLELDDAGTKLRVHDAEPITAVVLVDGGGERALVRGDRRGAWIPIPAGEGGRYLRVESTDGSLAWINPRRR